jgi:hypothetical protein
MDVEETSAGAETEQPVPIIRWKRGAEAPLLVRENAAAVALIASILNGTIVEWPPIEISEAVAVLIYRLMLDKEWRAAQFAQSTWADVYVVLASLARRERVRRGRSGQSAAGDRPQAERLASARPRWHPALARKVSWPQSRDGQHELR